RMLCRRAATRNDETLRLRRCVTISERPGPNLVAVHVRSAERVPRHKFDAPTETASLTAPPNRPRKTMRRRPVRPRVTPSGPNKPSIRRIINLLPEPLIVRILARRVRIHRHKDCGVITVPAVVHYRARPPQALLRERPVSLAPVYLIRCDTRPRHPHSRVRQQLVRVAGHGVQGQIILALRIVERRYNLRPHRHVS